MDELILHHYDGSPFSEKVRLILGFKGLAWRSVTVPRILPKPDVVALTGGYRRTPFLQTGADVWLDTALVARVLDRRRPEPPLYPPSAPLSPLLAQWADATLFWTVVPWVMQPAGVAAMFAGAPPEAAKAFGADRAAMTAGMKRLSTAEASVLLPQYLAALDGQLADGPGFLFGPRPTIADFSVAHCLWFVQRLPPVAHILAPHARLGAWLERMRALGHGQPTPMGSDEALAVARAAGGRFVPCAVAEGLGFAAGQRVRAAATDYGADPIVGTLVGLDADEAVIEREDPQAGTVHVHLPRLGYQIKPEETV
ncbi:glutathione S-transferase family protein [Aquabacterium sp. J223]|uniref:glutathione S-transferase family protein n=1 Tax=Aquabacterium sp. J223 TaxID=2898431 RepID=UPI0021AD8F1D|nr:glutathione S-transferase family protein [Aquabacterium sp. J223]UUX97259.1 glutathione S-transferase family protein [Aquabacterium sp. J223]